MDVQQNNTRERVFSILNDNDCPSFVIRQKPTTTSPSTKLPSISSFSPRPERPDFLRQVQYQRTSSISSAGSPPLIRYDSTSSKSSSSSMDSTPSPITPAYTFNDATHIPYDALRPDLGVPYLQPPSTITPFMEQQMMLNPVTSAPLPTFEPKSVIMPNISNAPYPAMPLQQDLQQLPTPALSNQASVSSSSSSAQSKPSPNNSNNNAAPPTTKKNKYPCPYAASHNCMATFTTSGHAARHGKKHTGEKGVHCPICNKAFTRKDNMKQHERTHKNAGTKNSEENKSKAAITKDAQKAKSHKKTESDVSTSTRRPSIIQSPLSEAPSLAPHTVDTPVNLTETTFYQDPSPPLLLAPDSTLVADPLIPNSMYPPLGDETMLSMSTSKIESVPPLPPTLVRGFSDLDTLAQAAESFDPYYQTQF